MSATTPASARRPIGRSGARWAAVPYVLGWQLAGALPARPTAAVFAAGADLLARRGGPGPAQLRRNLARLCPDADPARLDALVRAGLRSYARYWHELFRLPRTDPAAVHAATTVTGPGVVALGAALDRGRGVVIALPHSGNWDAAGVWMVQELARLGREPAITTVAQQLAPPLLRRFTDVRSRLGFEVVTAADGRAGLRRLDARLQAGGVVGLVADRVVTGAGVPVRLLGCPARLPGGPARLAARTGALLLPACSRFAGSDRWALQIDAPIPTATGPTAIVAATQSLADTFGRLLAVAPHDWHALAPIVAEDRPVDQQAPPAPAR